MFRQGGKMRWEYETPERQTLVADGRELWFHRPEERQVVVQRLEKAFARQTPLLFLFGKGDFAAEFSWEERVPPESAGVAVVTLLPRTPTPDMVELTLEMRPADCRIAATVLKDAFGNVTRLEFAGHKENSGLPDELFRFSPPPGTEVVRP